MTQPIFSFSLIRELRGSPLTILVAIVMLEQNGGIPITAQLLKECTGYGDHPIADSLRVLTSPTHQIVVRVVGGWRLVKGFQLPFEIENRDIRGFRCSTSSCLNKNQSMIYSQEREEQELQNRDIRGFEENRLAAIRAGIRDPKATALAKLPYVTPKFIQAHVTKALEEGNAIGTAIYRITNDWPVEVEEANPNGHPANCQCVKCKSGKFTGDWSQ